MKKYLLFITAAIMVMTIINCKSSTPSINSAKVTIKCFMKKNTDINYVKNLNVDYLQSMGFKEAITEHKIPATFSSSDDVFYFNFDEGYLNINAEKWIIDTIVYPGGTKTLLLKQEGSTMDTRMLAITDIKERSVAMLGLSKCKLYNGMNGGIDWDGNVTLYFGGIQ